MGISTTIIWVRYNYNYQLRDGYILFSSAKIWTGFDFGEFFKGCQVLKKIQSDTVWYLVACQNLSIQHHVEHVECLGFEISVSSSNINDGLFQSISWEKSQPEPLEHQMRARKRYQLLHLISQLEL